MKLFRTYSVLFITLAVLVTAVAAVVVARSSNTFQSNTPSQVSLPIVVPSTAGNADVVPSTGGASVGVPKEQPTSVVAAKGPHLSIPSLGINAPINSVGIAADGTMEVPYHLAEVGWYKYGTPIGDVGSAVIAGHVDNRLALPAVFFHLKNIKIGSLVYVTDEGGHKLTFRVTDVANYSVATAPVEEIFNDKSGQRLIRLITCEMTPTPAGALENSYDNRIVVTAKLVS